MMSRVHAANRGKVPSCLSRHYRHSRTQTIDPTANPNAPRAVAALGACPIPSWGPAGISRLDGGESSLVENPEVLLCVQRHVGNADRPAHERGPGLFREGLKVSEMPELPLLHLDLGHVDVEHPRPQHGEPASLRVVEHRLRQGLFHGLFPQRVDSAAVVASAASPHLRASARLRRNRGNTEIPVVRNGPASGAIRRAGPAYQAMVTIVLEDDVNPRRTLNWQRRLLVQLMSVDGDRKSTRLNSSHVSDS